MSQLHPPGSSGGWEALSTTGWHQHGPRPSRKLAGWALALTFVPLFFNWIASISLAVIALVRIRDGKAGGPVMAWTALLLSSGFFVSILVAAVIDLSNDPPASDSVTRGDETGDVSVLSLQAGDCLASEPSAEPQMTVPVEPCSNPHRGEVFAVFDLQADPSANQRRIDRLSEGGCIERFAAYVGIGYDESHFDVSYLRPVAGSLEVDRGVACIVSDPAGERRGSLRNSGP